MAQQSILWQGRKLGRIHKHDFFDLAAKVLPKEEKLAGFQAIEISLEQVFQRNRYRDSVEVRQTEQSDDAVDANSAIKLAA